MIIVADVPDTIVIFPTSLVADALVPSTTSYCVKSKSESPCFVITSVAPSNSAPPSVDALLIPTSVLGASVGVGVFVFVGVGVFVSVGEVVRY